MEASSSGEVHRRLDLKRDDRGRVVTVSGKSSMSEVSWTLKYDEAGNLITLTDGPQRWTWAYDDMGRRKTMSIDYSGDGRDDDRVTYVWTGSGVKAPKVAHDSPPIGYPSDLEDLPYSLPFEGTVTLSREKRRPFDGKADSIREWTERYRYDADGRRDREEMWWDGVLPEASPAMSEGSLEYESGWVKHESTTIVVQDKVVHQITIEEGVETYRYSTHMGAKGPEKLVMISDGDNSQGTIRYFYDCS